MKRILFFLLGLLVVTEYADAKYDSDSVDSEIPQATVFYEDPLMLDVEKDGVHYLYQEGEWPDMNGEVTNSMAFLRMYHDEDIEPPEVAEIPVLFEYDGTQYDVRGVFPDSELKWEQELIYRPLNTPEKQTFNTVRIPKEIYNSLFTLQETFDPYAWPDLPPAPKSSSAFYTIKAKNFEVDEENPALCDVDGILMSKDKKALLRFPVRREMINYYIPEYVEFLGSAFKGVQFPVFPNTHCRALWSTGPFYNYPFYGIYDTSGVCSPYWNVAQSEEYDYLKAIDHAFYGRPYTGIRALSYISSGYFEVYILSIYRAVFVVMHNFDYTNYTGAMPDWYDTTNPDNKLEIIELKSGTLSVEVRVFDGDQKLGSEVEKARFPDYAGERPVLTYAFPMSAYANYLKLYEDKQWPQNALIEPSPDVLYLYPELCHGPWIKGQTQFVYGACRFGNATIAERTWTTDNPSVATVDDTGVLTSHSPGTVTVSLKMTDGLNNQYVASQRIEIEDPDYTGSAVEEIASESLTSYPSGVYNLQGIRVGETIKNLPPGVYIQQGKKILVR